MCYHWFKDSGFIKEKTMRGQQHAMSSMWKVLRHDGMWAEVPKRLWWAVVRGSQRHKCIQRVRGGEKAVTCWGEGQWRKKGNNNVGSFIARELPYVGFIGRCVLGRLMGYAKQLISSDLECLFRPYMFKLNFYFKIEVQFWKSLSQQSTYHEKANSIKNHVQKHLQPIYDRWFKMQQ